MNIMRKYVRFIPSVCLILTGLAIQAQSKQVERWDVFEWSRTVQVSGNPFSDVSLKGVFTLGRRVDTVSGFYDGDGVFRIRYMPDTPGLWRFRTLSNLTALQGATGSFECLPAGKANHGMVKVDSPFQFKYDDGSAYYPFGTTCYAWTHQGDSLENLTLRTLANAPFNKMRMCVFPKRYDYCENEPFYYPYVRKPGVEGPKRWDFNRFDPAFFRHLEQRIIELGKLGIEADIILFHPYDKGHWGFDRMSHAQNIAYLRYLMSRLSAYRNVWWSVANEFDLVKTKQLWEWDAYVDLLHREDPYGHLLSVHHSMEYYDAWRPGITHASIQNGSLVEDFGRAGTLKDVYHKPVIYDEVGYEGNFQRRWGNLSAQKMVLEHWHAVLAATWTGHSETYLDPKDVVWWAKGGVLKGESPARIGFLRRLIEQTGPFDYIDKWRNDHTSITADRKHILIYFGAEQPSGWTFQLPVKTGLPDGTRFSAEIIDTWNMTRKPVSVVFTLKKTGDYELSDAGGGRIELNGKPYLAILLTRII